MPIWISQGGGGGGIRPPAQLTPQKPGMNRVKRHETKDKMIKNFLSPNRFEKLIDNDDSVDDLEDNDGLFEINCVNKNRSDKLPLKRPTVVCNNHPENQDVINKSYNNEKSTGKNIKIISDSIPRGLRMYEFNHYVTSGKAHLKAFLGATAKRLHDYILPTLYEDNPDVVILHVGYNDLSPKNGQLDDIGC